MPTREQRARKLGIPVDQLPDGRGKNPASWNNTKRGSDHHRWNAGRILNEDGYVKVRVGIEHPLADPNGYAYEHLVVWCSAGNPRPDSGELLHHRNEDRTDNRISNIELMPRGDHNAEHLARENRRCPNTGRLMEKRASNLLDGRLHLEWPL